MSTSSKPASAVLECVSALSGQAVLAISTHLFAVPLAQSTRHLQAVNRGQFQIDDDNLGQATLHLRQRGFTIVCDQRAIANRSQHLSDGVREGPVIFDD